MSSQPPRCCGRVSAPFVDLITSKRTSGSNKVKRVSAPFVDLITSKRTSGSNKVKHSRHLLEVKTSS